VRTSIVATIEPFFTTLLGVMLLGETMTRGTIVGGALIASAVLLLQVSGRSKSIATN
jgi:drug/metabolite transporter (DMT)-like permease